MPWRVTYYEEGEEPYSDDMAHFADAWQLTMPYPEEDGLAWQRMTLYDVESRFTNGENHICVSWYNQGTRTVLSRV